MCGRTRTSRAEETSQTEGDAVAGGRPHRRERALARVLEHDPPVCPVRVHHENRVPIDAGKRGVGHQEPAVGRVRWKDAGADNGEPGIATERRRNRRPRAFEGPVEHHALAVGDQFTLE